MLSKYSWVACDLFCRVADWSILMLFTTYNKCGNQTTQVSLPQSPFVPCTQTVPPKAAERGIVGSILVLTRARRTLCIPSLSQWAAACNLQRSSCCSPQLQITRRSHPLLLHNTRSAPTLKTRHDTCLRRSEPPCSSNSGNLDLFEKMILIKLSNRLLALALYRTGRFISVFTTGRCPKPAESIQHTETLFCNMRFNIILSHERRSPDLFFPSVFRLKFSTRI
jgi:hypothetical protein